MLSEHILVQVVDAKCHPGLDSGSIGIIAYMMIRLRTIFFVLTGLVGLWFLYAERGILTPFILAGIFAYVCNPVISFFSNKLNIPKTISIITIYLIFVGLLIIGSINLSSRIFEESSELHLSVGHILANTKTQLSGLPTWVRPTAFTLLTEVEKSRYVNFLAVPSLFPFVSQLVSKLAGFVVFLFSGFYFLKDGEEFIHTLLRKVPKDQKEDIEILLKKISSVLSGYLRGEVFLIFLMGIASYLALSILGIHYAASIAVFSGFAEIVPVIGPIVAGGVAVVTALVTGSANFGLNPVNAALVIILVYFVLRQLEDYFIIPHVMGQITKLPPFLIFFAVIAGGHLAGVLGLILAVPTTAILKLLLEYTFGKLATK